jgi:NTP pyrophosphatase (non-canonical NTP hydrolase)
MVTLSLPDGLTEADHAFLEAMARGLLTARAKYPGSKDRFLGFAGEAGEALHAVQRLVTGRGTVQELGAELRQVAQMACRLAVEGDTMFAPEVQAQFPVIVQPNPATLPHHPGHHG